MVVLLLFLILVVLLYATGLLPGVMKVISGFFACILLLAAGIYGWPTVMGGFAAAIAIAAFGVWLSVFNSSHSRRASYSDNDIHRQIEKANADQKRRREEKESEKQRRIEEQVSRTESIGKN